MLEVPNGYSTETLVKARMMSGKISATSMAIFTS